MLGVTLRYTPQKVKQSCQSSSLGDYCPPNGMPVGMTMATVPVSGSKIDFYVDEGADGIRPAQKVISDCPDKRQNDNTSYLHTNQPIATLATFNEDARNKDFFAQNPSFFRLQTSGARLNTESLLDDGENAVPYDNGLKMLTQHSAGTRDFVAKGKAQYNPPRFRRLEISERTSPLDVIDEGFDSRKEEKFLTYAQPMQFEHYQLGNSSRQASFARMVIQEDSNLLQRQSESAGRKSFPITSSNRESLYDDCNRKVIAIARDNYSRSLTPSDWEKRYHRYTVQTKPKRSLLTPASVSRQSQVTHFNAMDEQSAHHVQMQHTDQTDLKSSPVELPFYQYSMVDCGSNNDHGHHRHLADSESKVTPPNFLMKPVITNTTKSRHTTQISAQTFAEQEREDYENPRLHLGSTVKKQICVVVDSATDSNVHTPNSARKVRRLSKISPPQDLISTEKALVKQKSQKTPAWGQNEYTSLHRSITNDFNGGERQQREAYLDQNLDGLLAQQMRFDGIEMGEQDHSVLDGTYGVENKTMAELLEIGKVQSLKLTLPGQQVSDHSMIKDVEDTSPQRSLLIMQGALSQHSTPTEESQKSRSASAAAGGGITEYDGEERRVQIDELTVQVQKQRKQRIQSPDHQGYSFAFVASAENKIDQVALTPQAQQRSYESPTVQPQNQLKIAKIKQMTATHVLKEAPISVEVSDAGVSARFSYQVQSPSDYGALSSANQTPIHDNNHH